MMPIELSGLVDSLGWALLHSSWQIAIVSALVYAALRVAPRESARLRFALGYFGMVASLLAFIVTAAVCFGTTGTEAFAVAVAAEPSGFALVVEMLGKTTSAIGLCWSGGFIWLGARYIHALRETQKLRHEGTSAVPAIWERRFRLWIERLGADCNTIILQSSRIATPITIGALKPVVLVPTGFFLRLPSDQAEAVLLHEIAHVCRQDYLLGLVQAMISTIFFFHPGIHFLSRQIDIEREFACDARAVAETGNAVSLARGLSRIALASHGPLPVFAMAADGKRTPVMDRIGRLGDRPVRRETGVSVPAVALAMVFAACAMVAVGADASLAKPETGKAEANPAQTQHGQDMHSAMASPEQEIAAPTDWPDPALHADSDSAAVTVRADTVSAVRVALSERRNTGMSRKPSQPSYRQPTAMRAMVETVNFEMQLARDVAPVRSGFRFAIFEPPVPPAPPEPPEEDCEDARTRDHDNDGHRRANRTARSHAERADRIARSRAERADRSARSHAERDAERAERMARNAERHADRIEREMEQRADRMERLAERMEDEAERRAEEIERRIEQREEQYEVHSITISFAVPDVSGEADYLPAG